MQAQNYEVQGIEAQIHGLKENSVAEYSKTASLQEGDPCLEEGGRSYDPATYMEKDCDKVAEVSGFDKGQEAHHVALVDDLDLRVERGRYQTKSYLKRKEEEDKEEDEGLELWSDVCGSSCPLGSWALVLCCCQSGFICAVYCDPDLHRSCYGPSCAGLRSYCSSGGDAIFIEC
ncbi:hypothetical protein U1Q18_020368 [Sarracenia purpurea var. burkii]